MIMMSIAAYFQNVENLFKMLDFSLIILPFNFTIFYESFSLKIFDLLFEYFGCIHNYVSKL